jgi:iron complex outermembrane receptor protein
MRIFASVQSVFTMTGYSGVDPTAGLNGLDNNIYPRSRTFSGGLNVRF